MNTLYEDKVLVSKEFECKTTADSFSVTSSLAICDNYEELKYRLSMEGFKTFLICKN